MACALAELPSLMFLRLDHTTITERTLDALSGKDLRRVSIQDVDVRLEAAERFEASLPAVLPFQYAPMPSQEHRLGRPAAGSVGSGCFHVAKGAGEGAGEAARPDESPVNRCCLCQTGRLEDRAERSRTSGRTRERADDLLVGAGLWAGVSRKAR